MNHHMRVIGTKATILAMGTYFYWPQMSNDIHEYISQRVVCQKMKNDLTKPYGLLQPLSTPKTPWEIIAIDFIFGLSKSQHNNNGVWTIIDRFSILAKKTIKPHHMAILFIAHIFKHHGFPKTIIF